VKTHLTGVLGKRKYLLIMKPSLIDDGVQWACMGLTDNEHERREGYCLCVDESITLTRRVHRTTRIFVSSIIGGNIPHRCVNPSPSSSYTSLSGCPAARLIIFVEVYPSSMPCGSCVCPKSKAPNRSWN
jgi:hypothetical protein